MVNFTERAKERKRANVRVVALRVLIAVVSVAVVAGLAWLLLFSSVFRLETSEIGVSGANEWVSAQTIHAIADKQAGKSLFLVSAHEVTEQLKSIPGVSEAKVSKQFPKSMSVEVKAQRPAAMLKRGDTLTAVDSQARVLNSVKNANEDGIPVIEVKDIAASLKNRSVKEALTILGALPESMRKSITKVTAETLFIKPHCVPIMAELLQKDILEDEELGMDQENRLDVEQMIELLEKHDFKKLKEELESVHPVDIVDALEELDKKQRILIFRLLA